MKQSPDASLSTPDNESIDLEALTRFINATYDLGSEVRLRRGPRSTAEIYYVDLPGSDGLVAKVYQHLGPPPLDLVVALRAQGAPLAAPIPTRANDLACAIPSAKKTFMVLSHRASGQPLRVDVRDAGALGTALAQLHIAADKLSFNAIPILPQFDASLLLDQPVTHILPFFEAVPKERDRFAAIAVALRERLIALSQVSPNFGVCHGDAHFLNAHFDSARGVTLFDFDEINRGFRAYDLGTALWGTLGRGGKPDVWSALIAHYSKVRILSNSEAETITTFMAVRQIWWMGFHARTWGRYRLPWLDDAFFIRSLDLLSQIALEACGIDE